MIDTINSWLEWHGIQPLRKNMVPEVCVKNDHAAGFLLETNTDVAIIEYLVSNPTSSPRKVRVCICAVIEELVRVANKKGFKRVCGFTNIPGIARIAKECGFNQRDQFLMFEKRV